MVAGGLILTGLASSRHGWLREKLFAGAGGGRGVLR